MGGDILDEDFEAPGYENSWTEDVDGGDIDDSNQDATPPSGGGSYICKVTKTSGTYDAQALHNTTPSTYAVTYTTFYVRVNAEGLGTNNHVALAAGAGSGAVWTLQLRQVAGGDRRFRFVMQGIGNYWFPTSSDITLDQWYRIDVKIDTTSNAWEWRVDEDVKDSGSDSLSDDLYRWYIGGLDNYTATFYVDLFNVDSSGYVSFGAADLGIDVSECE
jgi:hypothetical protein